MDLGLEGMCIHMQANKREIEPNTHPKTRNMDE